MIKYINLLKNIIISIRPQQWSKNCLLFAGLIFSGKLVYLKDAILSIQAFIIFCLGSGSIYIINDIVDRKSDKKHPIKKNRPIASGKLSVGIALTVMVVMLVISCLWSIIQLNRAFTFAFLGYIILMLFYIFKFKQMVILDLIAVAVGFVLRAVAGGLVINVRISPWLIICTLLLALLMLMGKRRHELLILKNRAYAHRLILKEYSMEYIDQLIAVVTSSTVVCYSLYTFFNNTVSGLSAQLMPLTIPFVLYGIFRYLYLTYRESLGGSPELLLIKDRHLLISILLWAAFVVFLIYFI